jgi:hypothetical protein
MSGEPSESTNRPKPGAKIDPLGYFIGVDFFPPIKLERKAGLAFATKLAEYPELDPQAVELESNQWNFLTAQHETKLKIEISSNGLQLIANRPSTRRGEEWYDERYQIILRLFAEQFNPKLILGSKAMIRGLLAVDGDARLFLGVFVMQMPAEKLKALGRPLHGLGIRFFFPAYEEIGGDAANPITGATADWSVDAKVESYIPNPSQLFLEADAKWQSPEPWTDDAVHRVVSRLQLVSSFLTDKIVGLLQHDNNPDAEG